MGLLSFLNPLAPLISAAERAYVLKLNAANDEERIKADQEIAFWEGRIELAKSAAQHDKWWSPRSLMGISVSIYVAKLIVWDTVLKLGSTPYPGEHVAAIVTTVIGFYFAARVAETVSTSIVGAIDRRGSMK